MLPTLDEEHGLDFTLNKIPTDKLHQMGWNMKSGLSMAVAKMKLSK